MSESPAMRSELWRRRLQRIREFVRRGIPFASGVLAAFVALLLYSALTPKPHLITPAEVKDTVNQVMASATPAPAYSSLAYQVILPSLVLIQSHNSTADEKDANSLGSGVIVDDMGDILTCYHVIADADEIQVTFADGTQSSARVVLKQPENDIAVLRALQQPDVLVPATLGNPAAMHVGDEAYVVGNPFGLYATMTSGVISGLNRTFQPRDSDVKLTNLIQIDAAVNPGNSGGPLVNRYGEVVGIVVALLNPTDQDFFVGVGLAIPITTAGGGLGAPPY